MARALIIVVLLWLLVAVLFVLLIGPVFADDSVQVYLAFVFFKNQQGNEQSIIIGSDSLPGCQEAFKAMLSGVGGDATDFSVAGCKPYLMSNLPKS